MTNEELYQTLSREDFSAPQTGTLFFPAYIYRYDPEKEYLMRKQIDELKSRLERPAKYFDTLIIDIFEFFLEYLQGKSFGKHPSLLDFLMQKESERAADVHESLRRASHDRAFFQALSDKINIHQDRDSEVRKPYVFIHGFGKIFPWLRVNSFLSNFEQHIGDFKLILFYPGTYDGSLSLFGKLHSENPYRSIKLINI